MPSLHMPAPAPAPLDALRTVPQPQPAGQAPPKLLHSRSASLSKLGKDKLPKNEAGVARTASLSTRPPRNDSLGHAGLARSGSLQRVGSLTKRVPPPKVRSIDLNAPEPVKEVLLQAENEPLPAAGQERQPIVGRSPPTVALDPVIPPTRSSSLRPPISQNSSTSSAIGPRVNWFEVDHKGPSDPNAGNRVLCQSEGQGSSPKAPKRSLSFKDMRVRNRSDSDPSSTPRCEAKISRSTSERVSPFARALKRVPARSNATSALDTSTSTKPSLRTRAATLASKITPTHTPSPAQVLPSKPKQGAPNSPPDHFAPPTFTAAEVTILRTQLTASSQQLVRAAEREHELERMLRESEERALVGREILWGIVGERDAREEELSAQSEALRLELGARQARLRDLEHAHALEVEAMQREIEALSRAWLRGAPPVVVSSPLDEFPLPSTPSTTAPAAGASATVDVEAGLPFALEEDFPTGPISVASDLEREAMTPKHARHQTMGSTKTGFGLFRDEDPLDFSDDE